MAKYEVKDINKNGVEDAWEIAKYAKANAAAEGSPTKMIGGIAGAMTGALGGATNLGVQSQQGAASVGPQQPPSAFNPNSMLTGQGIYGSMDQRQQSVGAPFQFTDQKDIKNKL